MLQTYFLVILKSEPQKMYLRTIFKPESDCFSIAESLTFSMIIIIYTSTQSQTKNIQVVCDSMEGDGMTGDR